MFTQESLNDIFSILRKIHTSHWRAPNEVEVNKQIQETGVFIFRIGKGTLIAEVRFSDKIEYIVNEELTSRFLEKAKEFKKKFDELIESL